MEASSTAPDQANVRRPRLQQTVASALHACEGRGMLCGNPGMFCLHRANPLFAQDIKRTVAPVNRPR